MSAAGGRREWLSRYALLAPTVFYVAAIALLPILFTLWLSFRRQLPIFRISRFVALENYAFLLEDARFWNALGNTAYFVAVSVTLELVLGLGFALLLNQKFRGRALARALVLTRLPSEFNSRRTRSPSR